MNGTYLRFVGGQAVSVLGDQVWYVALSWSAVRLASPSAAGAVMAVSALPRLAFLLLGGALVDRGDSRRLMIGSDRAERRRRRASRSQKATWRQDAPRPQSPSRPKSASRSPRRSRPGSATCAGAVSSVRSWWSRS